MHIYSVEDEEFCRYGRVLAGVPEACTQAVTAALDGSTPLPEATDYVASEPALEALPQAAALKGLLFGGRPTQLGWCNGHNTRLNCLEYHRASEFNLGTRDFILLLAKLDDIDAEGRLDTACVRAFRVPAGTLVEVYSTTLHYAPCMVDTQGFRVMVALPQGTNGPAPELSPELAAAADAPLLWAADKWLLAHAESAEAAAGAAVRLTGENLDIAADIA